MSDNVNNVTGIYGAVAEFIRTFGAPLDPLFWLSLVKEELAELNEADMEAHGSEAVLKEMTDLAYVLAGLYLTMPDHLDALVSDEVHAEIDEVLSEVEEAIFCTMRTYGFTPEVVQEALSRVHKSNMSKRGPDGKPIRREDGKILKGPYYKAPNLSDLVS